MPHDTHSNGAHARNRSFFCSWSGGKDSCLALHRARQSGMECASLFTMLVEDGGFSRSHGQTHTAIRAQAEAMHLPLKTARASWEAYEDVFKQAGRSFVEQGIRGGVFGDIDLEAHREWIERVCGEIGACPHLPLWQSDRRVVVTEFLESGFLAVIVAVNSARLDTGYLGRKLDLSLLNELESEGVDLCGEDGEYHTFVYDGPLFARALSYTPGKVREHKGYAFVTLDVRQ
jgi:uncharacterized protein (TIGR00290 family)